MGGPNKGSHSFVNWLKKTRKEKELMQVIAICLVLLALCILIASFHVSRIYDAFEASSYDYIINRSDISSKYFSESFYENL